MIHTADYPRKTMKNMWWLYAYCTLFGLTIFALTYTTSSEEVWFVESILRRIIFAAAWTSFLFALAYYAMRENDYYFASIPIDGSARVLFFIYAWLFWIPLAVSWWRMKRTIELNKQADAEAERLLRESLERQLTKGKEERFPTDELRRLTDYCISEAKIIDKEPSWDELSARYAKIMNSPVVERLEITTNGPCFWIRAFYVPEWALNVFWLDDDWTRENQDEIWLAPKYDLGDYCLTLREHHQLELVQFRSGMRENERKADLLGYRLVKYIEEHYASTLQPWLYAGKIDEVILKVAELLNDGHCVDQLIQERHFLMSEHYHEVPKPIDGVIRRRVVESDRLAGVASPDSVSTPLRATQRWLDTFQ